MENIRLNYLLLLLLIIVASTLGFIVDFLIGWSDFPFLYTIAFFFLLVLIFWERLYNIKPRKGEKILNNKNRLIVYIRKIEIGRYTIWSYFGCYLASSLVWGITFSFLNLLPEYSSNINRWYISITITTIIMSLAGDIILEYWFKLQGILRILNYKEHLVNQNNIRIYIYIAYLLLMFYVFSVGTDANTQLWINCFATFVAFDRVKTNWKLIFNKNFKS